MNKKNEYKKRKKEKAVALSYNPLETAPKLVAKGEGIIAEKIVEKGLEENITIYEDGNLVESLMGLEINEEIPEELYEAVAEIIFYIYKLDAQKRG